jgi:hypothetical protein
VRRNQTEALPTCVAYLFNWNLHHKKVVPLRIMESEFGGTKYSTGQLCCWSCSVWIYRVIKREHLWLKGREYSEDLGVDGRTLLILFSGEYSVRCILDSSGSRGEGCCEQAYVRSGVFADSWTLVVLRDRSSLKIHTSCDGVTQQICICPRYLLRETNIRTVIVTRKGFIFREDL